MPPWYQQSQPRKEAGLCSTRHDHRQIARYRSFAFGVLLCATVGSSNAGALELRDAASVSGYGVGQMACSKFSDAIRRMKAGQDDGLYFAFLAWRDGYISAAGTPSSDSSTALAHFDEWLAGYCARHPRDRFATAVKALVRQLNMTRAVQVPEDGRLSRPHRSPSA